MHLEQQEINRDIEDRMEKREQRIRYFERKRQRELDNIPLLRKLSILSDKRLDEWRLRIKNM